MLTHKKGAESPVPNDLPDPNLRRLRVQVSMRATNMSCGSMFCYGNRCSRGEWREKLERRGIIPPVSDVETWGNSALVDATCIVRKSLTQTWLHVL